MANEIESIAKNLQILKGEIEPLLDLLGIADEMQWEAAPTVSTVDEETADRKATRGPADPTGDTVACPTRLDLRKQLQRSDSLVAHALVSIIGVRRGIEIQMARWEDEQRDTPK